MSEQSVREQMIQRMRALIRDDFAEVLADALEAAPTVESIRAAAIKSPDRWGQLVAVLARLTGFRDQVDLEHSGDLTALVASVRSMSDGELLDRIRALKAADTVVPLPLATTAAADAPADAPAVSPALPAATPADPAAPPRAACA